MLRFGVLLLRSLWYSGSQSLRYFKQQKGRLKIFQTTLVLLGNS